MPARRREAAPRVRQVEVADYQEGGFGRPFCGLKRGPCRRPASRAWSVFRQTGTWSLFAGAKTPQINNLKGMFRFRTIGKGSSVPAPLRSEFDGGPIRRMGLAEASVRSGTAPAGGAPHRKATSRRQDGQNEREAQYGNDHDGAGNAL